MTTASIELVAQAEKILSRTLAYQAAIAVHELKDRLGLDVAELRLVVMPQAVTEPGCYRVVCYAITPIGKRAKGAGRGQPAKPKSGCTMTSSVTGCGITRLAMVRMIQKGREGSRTLGAVVI